MNSRVSQLNGYVAALSEIDGEQNDAFASAKILKLDDSDFVGSIRMLPEHLSHVGGRNYVFGDPVKVSDPNKELFLMLTNFLFLSPFSELFSPDNTSVTSRRTILAMRVIDMVRVVTDDFFDAKIVSIEVKTSDGMTGNIFLFPIEENFLMLKTLSRVGRELTAWQRDPGMDEYWIILTLLSLTPAELELKLPGRIPAENSFYLSDSTLNPLIRLISVASSRGGPWFDEEPECEGLLEQLTRMAGGRIERVDNRAMYSREALFSGGWWQKLRELSSQVLKLSKKGPRPDLPQKIDPSDFDDFPPHRGCK